MLALKHASIEVLDAKTEFVDPSNPFGQVQSGFLRLRCMLARGYLRERIEVMKTNWTFRSKQLAATPFDTSDPDRYQKRQYFGDSHVNVVWDRGEPALDRAYYCMLVNQQFGGCGLVVQPTGRRHGEYERLGYFAILTGAQEDSPARFSELCRKPLEDDHFLSLPEDTVEETERKRYIVRYTLIGVIGAIINWNFPILLTTGKVAPALLTGNTIIVKPSPFTPYCALKPVELAQKFFPPGVVQSISDQLLGSTATGKLMMKSCSKTLKRVVLELGGNDPAIIYPDVCLNFKRLFIHESIYDKFLAAVVAYVETMTVGNGLNEGIVLDPLQNSMQFEKVQTFFDDILKQKWNVAVGGKVEKDCKGYFIHPMICQRTAGSWSRSHSARPLVPALSMITEDEVIARANNSPMGLGASAWTKDLDAADRTMTMKAALEILGIPTWHWVTMAENPPDLAMWAEAIEAKFNPASGKQPFGRSEFDNLLGYWGACTDQPSVLFVEELVKAYPEAKVVLCERDVNRWFKSYTTTVIDGSANPFVPFAAFVDPGFLGRMAQQTNLIAKFFFNVKHPKATDAFFGRKPFFEQWKSNAKSTYLAHNEHVKRVTPADRLLLFDLADGWGPLCKFLGKPVPDVPFPRVNETLAVQEKIQLYIAESFKRTIMRMAKRAAPFVVLLCVVAALWTWR
ncbi:hypothetical protein B0A55_04016 [Friedmanniomyces simplex]|uniref:aldehyde dehydrogenase (NAD(+)) n=1 Tax=Friedmanniomyces simplex TaxID=329884 RepID=A0A4U0X4Q3_9PEZI|nr:hypothetical protein B0A55_04016 [Friedmanniomyces simplex]